MTILALPDTPAGYRYTGLNRIYAPRILQYMAV